MLVRSVLVPMVAASSALAATLPLRVVSFNIRYDAGDREDNELPWWTLFCVANHDWCRSYHLSSQLGDYLSEPEVAVAGLQEVLKNQLSDILGNLGATWASIGVGRDDGADEGEFSPILYDTAVLSVVFSETKWLSPTPDAVSFGWGARARRVVTLAVFEHTASKKRFLHANTHLDNASNEARVEGLKVAVARVQRAQASHGPLGVTLTGDFNSDPTGDAAVALRALDYVSDVWDSAAERLGPHQLTYSGFSDTGRSRIDFVMHGPNADALYTANRTEIVSNKVGDVFISDHRMVYGDLILA